MPHRKTIEQLISELKIFENQQLCVEILREGGLTPKPISLVGKHGRLCVLENLESSYAGETLPDFVVRGKTIVQLIRELQTFENQGLFVELSFDARRTHEPVGTVAAVGDRILLSPITT